MVSGTYKERLLQVYKALQEKGYRPVEQIVGYILTEDPTYITNHNRARQLISRNDREILLHDIVATYFSADTEWEEKCPSAHKWDND